MPSSSMSRAIDHLVLAAHDLTAQADIYRRMGFTVGVRNRHPWGTENHIIQFAESFLELIALGEDFEQRQSDNFFARFISESLKHREGFAMLSLCSQDAAADAAAFAAAGIGDGRPFHFGRKARRPGGQEVEVAFTLAFAHDPLIEDAGFFTCQQHFPQNFWNPAFQTHANSAHAISSIFLVAQKPGAHVSFLEKFCDGHGSAALNGTDHVVLPLGLDQKLEIFTPAAAHARFGAAVASDASGFIGAGIKVARLAELYACLSRNGILFEDHGSFVIVPYHAACGSMLLFHA